MFNLKITGSEVKHGNLYIFILCLISRGLGNGIQKPLPVKKNNHKVFCV